MTREEVIDTLQTWIKNADDEYDREEMGRVVGLKEALHEIKKIEPCEDCISRTELLSRIDAERKHLLDLKMDGAEHIIVHHARRIIEDMPVAGSED
jgi:hypothetical protein